MKPGIFATSLMLAFVLFSASVQAAKRVALVIGNGEYAVNKLRNPVNDATAVAAKLKGMGFTVVEGHNLDRMGMHRLVQEFRAEMTPGGIAMVFYAGHGIEHGGQNFLLPVDDDQIQSKEDLPIAALSAQYLLDQMRAGENGLNILILDACRSDPWATKTRALGPVGGLAAMDMKNVSGTLIAYATHPGSVAQDGAGRHSPYTEALLAHLGTPGVEIKTLFNNIGWQVATATKGEQAPWTTNSPLPPGTVLLSGQGQASTDAIPMLAAETAEDDPVEPLLEEADALAEKGDRQGAARAYDRAIALARERTAAAPQDLDRRISLIDALRDRAYFEDDNEDTMSALRWHDESVRLATALYRERSEEALALFALSRTLNSAIDSSNQNDDVATARRYLEQFRLLKPAFAKTCGKELEVELRLSACFASIEPDLRQVQFAIKADENALPVIRKHQQALDRLVKAEPALDAPVKVLQAIGGMEVAKYYGEQRKWREAREAYAGARASLAAMPATLPKIDGFQGIVDSSFFIGKWIDVRQAEMELDAGEPAEAVRLSGIFLKSLPGMDLGANTTALGTIHARRIEARAQMAMQEYARARTAWEAILRDMEALNPPGKDAEAHASLGDISSIENDWNASVAHYRKAIEQVDPDTEDGQIDRILYLADLAYVHDQSGNLQSAVDTYGEIITSADRFLRLRPNRPYPSVAMTLANALHLQGALQIELSAAPPKHEVAANLHRARALLKQLEGSGQLPEYGKPLLQRVEEAIEAVRKW